MWDPGTIGAAVGATVGTIGAVFIGLKKAGILTVGRPSSNGDKDLSGSIKELDIKFTELKHNQMEMFEILKEHSGKLDKLNGKISYINGVLEHFKS